ncbi:flagellar basal-body MS-ring/collar protein FliF [uncultured Legionella sp.]|uniref:flagellar basal-body MS-ring/collar protein FliF n=1 Tax=uncultured Legionella sp. TaxID=210934 RepID=UPI0026164C0E|nr:flagellar basal-body MS-ring/collar protein FliF [uncultured Legionella sp.]
MALADNASTAAAKFASLSIPRQVGLMVGLAASVAIGLAVVLWSREPSYMPLYSQMNPRDATEVMAVLERSGIEFKIDQNHGTLLIPADKLQTARLKLAAEGLPRESGGSEAMFASNGTFNSSQFMENARYKQALEAELARTISKFNNIKSARVHLAIPRESAFVRDSQAPSASVFIDVYSGVELKKHTIAAIINLVASSIPSLNSSRVTVVDQDGQLLSEGGGQTLFSDTERFLDYRQSLEQQYSQKIQEILTPILGYGRVRAKVSADIDFTSYEQTQEVFNPEQSAVRSEQTMQEQRSSSNSASGVPGSLTNTPLPNPALGQKNVPPNNGAAANNQAQQNASAQSNGTDTRSQSTKNFELDKTVSHTKNQPGTIKRLSVAVLVDNKAVMNDKTKKMEKKPLTAKEIDEIKLLVSDAIGLNAKRGDSLNVINSNFIKPDPIKPIPAERFWQKDSFWSIVKQTGGALFVLALIFGVLRPMLKTLASDKEDEEEQAKAPGELGYEGHPSLAEANDYESQLNLLRQVVDKEPKRVAQVVKSWVDRG